MPAEAHPDTADVWPVIDLGKLRQVEGRAYLTRFALGASISLVAALIGRAVGARFGGLFLAFPAILPASLTLLEEKEGTRRADRDAIGAVLGGLALAVFAGVGEATFGRVPAWLALLLALTGWLLTSFGLYAVLAVLRPEDCDRNLD